MDLERLIEDSLHAALREATAASCPPLLAQALNHSVFPGGQRLRPRLLCAVAAACDGRDKAAIAAAASAIELIHCASLVHDDLQPHGAAVRLFTLPLANPSRFLLAIR